jgi:hypothetical protein
MTVVEIGLAIYNAAGFFPALDFRGLAQIESCGFFLVHIDF